MTLSQVEDQLETVDENMFLKFTNDVFGWDCVTTFEDGASGRELIDLYSFYASQPIGFNHPYFERPDVKAYLLAAAKIKVANADIYTTQYATFVNTFARVMGVPSLERFFFIEGGALAVENALKAAMDWK